MFNQKLAEKVGEVTMGVFDLFKIPDCLNSEGNTSFP